MKSLSTGTTRLIALCAYVFLLSLGVVLMTNADGRLPIYFIGAALQFTMGWRIAGLVFEPERRF